MGTQVKQVYEFGPFRLDPAQRLLLREGEPVQITPKTFQILLALVESAGEVVTKDELMARVWPDALVEEQNLSKNVFLLRKALGENGDRPYIENIPKVGYRFLGDVRQSANSGPALVVEKHERLRIVATEEETQQEAPVEDSPYRNIAAFNLESHSARGRNLKPVFLAVGFVVAAGLALAVFFLWPKTKTQPAEPEPARESINAQPAAIKSIAVLPFKPLSKESSDQYLELGMADTLITRLSSLSQIIVRPTSAIRGYMDFGQDPLVAGRELMVDSVLEGSIQRLDDRVRVTVRLLRVSDGKPLWAYQCDEKSADLFKVQDAVSERVASALISSLSSKDKELLAKRYTQNLEAYEAYVKGRYFWNRRNTEGCKKAIEFYNRAIEIDPNYALAYSGIADALWFISDSWSSKTETEARIKAAIRKALSIDESLAEAHASLGLLLQNYEWDWQGAEREYRRAVELNPNYATARHWYGEYLALMGRFDEAIAEINRAQEIDPLSVPVSADKAKILYLARRHDEAIEQSRKTLELDPNFVFAYHWLVLAHCAKGQHEEALTILRELNQPDDFFLTTALTGYVYGMTGKKAEARRALALLNENTRRSHVMPICFIVVYLGLGDKDRAFEFMEKAFNEHYTDLNASKVAAVYDSLRSDPRFTDMVRRLRFPE